VCVLQCSVLQYVCCSCSQCSNSLPTLSCAAACCVAVCCSALQWVAAYVLQCDAQTLALSKLLIMIYHCDMICIYVYIHTRKHTHTRTHMHTHIRTYIYIYTYIHTHTYTYIHIQMSPPRCNRPQQAHKRIVSISYERRRDGQDTLQRLGNETNQKHFVGRKEGRTRRKRNTLI